MSFNLNQFTRIVSTVEDTLSMLDDAEVSISTKVENSSIILNLSFPLKNGFAEISIGEEDGVIIYFNNTGEVLEEIEFIDRDIYDIKAPFNQAIKRIIAADKQNSQSKAKSNPGISTGDSELDRVRAELSSIN
jgi:hypothetical protein